MYIIKLMSGEKITVNKSEYQTIMSAEKGIFIPRIESFINKSFIAAAYPELSADQVEDKKTQQLGILHDGTRVRRHFGQWVDAEMQVPDDKGNYMPVKIDPTYYPEVALDCVPTIKEFEQLRHLPTDERRRLIINDKSPARLGGDLEPLNKLL